MLVFYVGGLSVLTDAVPRLISGWQVLRDEVVVQSMVEWTWQEPVLCKNGQCISYGIEYSLAAGTVFWGQTSLTTGRWASLHIGSPIQAWYVSGDPDRNELSHGSAFWVSLYAVLSGLALVGLGVGGFLVVMIRVGRISLSAKPVSGGKPR